MANSPYVVTGSVLVSTGVTLTIEPGVQVSFQQGKLLKVDGTLIADGNASAIIRFTSAQNTPAAGDWGPIKFSGLSGAAVLAGPDYVSGSIFRYARIEYGLGIGLVAAYPFFSNNMFFKNAGNSEGVVTGCVDSDSALHWTGVQNSSGTLVVRNNVFEENAAAGFATNHPGSGSKFFLVLSNQFLKNAGTAVAICDDSSGAEITSNFLMDNAAGIALGTASDGVIISNNIIMGSFRPANTSGIAIDIYSGSPLIENNLISGNKQNWGWCSGRCAIINVFSLGQPSIVNNTFWGNQTEALVSFRFNTGGTFHGNNFENNQVQHLFYREPDSPAGVNATGNYWGTTDAAVIESLIYDFYDDFEPGTIAFAPFLSARNPAAPLPRIRRAQVTSQ